MQTNMDAISAAEYLQLAENTLAKMRIRGTGPRFARPVPGRVIYRQADLDAWLDSKMVQSTSERPK